MLELKLRRSRGDSLLVHRLGHLPVHAGTINSRGFNRPELETREQRLQRNIMTRTIKQTSCLEFPRLTHQVKQGSEDLSTAASRTETRKATHRAVPRRVVHVAARISSRFCTGGALRYDHYGQQGARLQPIASDPRQVWHRRHPMPIPKGHNAKTDDYRKRSDMYTTN